MKIAVTAATGQLGAAIVNALKKEVDSQNIIGLVRTPKKAGHLGIEARKGDYNSREDLNQSLAGVDVVLLVSGNDDPQKRIPQHRNVIEAAKQNGVQKIVYTSIVGAEDGNSFSPIVQSNRQTEEDIKASGLNWAIGRNCIYIEPDLEYLDTYIKEGAIRNCAGDGKCGYTSRHELGAAYANLILNEQLNGHSYNLAGAPVSQAQLVDRMNQAFGTELRYQSLSFEEYEKERKEELGDFLGTVIAGIYEGMRTGAYDVASDFERVTGRKHLSLVDMIQNFKA